MREQPPSDRKRRLRHRARDLQARVAGAVVHGRAVDNRRAGLHGELDRAVDTLASASKQLTAAQSSLAKKEQEVERMQEIITEAADSMQHTTLSGSEIENQLHAYIEQAPHEATCVRIAHGRINECTCWKSRALSAPTEGGQEG